MKASELINSLVMLIVDSQEDREVELDLSGEIPVPIEGVSNLMDGKFLLIAKGV